ncbi:MAG: ParA family protein [Ruminococcus sp.]|nr:ParA family protein [Ruminococcus sp.]
MKNTTIIAIANQKGGVAKTTTAINLGAALGTKGYKVLLIDLDTQESLSNFLGIYGAENNIGKAMYTVIGRESFSPADFLVYNEKNGVYILPSELNTMNRLEKDLISVRSKETVLRKVIGTIKSECDFDYIIIDCLASLNVLLDNALTAANKVLIPCQASPLSYAALPNLLLQIEDIQADLNSDLDIVGIAATLVERTKNSAQTVEMLRQNYSELLFDTVIERSSAAANSAITEKAVIFSNAKDNKVAAEYRSLCDELVSRLGA